MLCMRLIRAFLNFFHRFRDFKMFLTYMNFWIKKIEALFMRLRHGVPLTTATIVLYKSWMLSMRLARAFLNFIMDLES